MSERQAYETIEVHPLTPSIGAEIGGVDLSKRLWARQFDDLRRAFLEHHVLVFRDQRLSGQDRKHLAHRVARLRESALHTLMLHTGESPEGLDGGGAFFANMYLAYDVLSDAMKAFLEGLTAIHDGEPTSLGSYAFERQPPPGASEYPLIVRHPDTGRKALFVNCRFVSHIVQLSPPESAAVIEMLYRVIETNPWITCKVRWMPNAVVFWDSRCAQRHALLNYDAAARVPPLSITPSLASAATSSALSPSSSP